MRNAMGVVFVAAVGAFTMVAGCGSTASPESSSSGGATMTATEALRAGYVRTPFGLVHPSCVHAVDDESTVHADSVRTPDGREQKLEACQFARVPAEKTESIEPNAQPDATQATDGWTATTWYNATAQLGFLSTTFKVPQAPTTDDGQTLFFFPSFKPAGTVPGDGRIIQPVLQWGPSSAGGGSFWAAASWELDLGTNTVLNTSLIRVSSGDTISGVIQGNTPCPNGACQSWTVITKDVTKNTSKTLTNMGGHVYTQAQGAVLEQYGSVSCSDYPNDSGITFSSIVLKDQNFNVLTPTWQNITYSNISPQCNFKVTSTSSSNTIAY